MKCLLKKILIYILFIAFMFLNGNSINVDKSDVNLYEQTTLYKNGLYGWPCSVICADKIFPSKSSKLPLICIIDSGIKTTNKFLNSRNIRQIILDNNSKNSKQSHGTMIAGLIVGIGNGISEPGGFLPNSKLLSIQAGTDERMTIKELVTAIKIATNMGAKVINMSIATPISSLELKNVIEYAQSKGIISVAASGNYNKKTNYFPAAYEGVIAVSTLDKNKNLGCNSNYSSKNILAPGDSLLTTSDSDDGLGWINGSSSATAIVSSACAIILSIDKSISSRNMNSLLYRTSNIVHKGSYKYHLLNVESAINSIKTLSINHP